MAAKLQGAVAEAVSIAGLPATAHVTRFTAGSKAVWVAWDDGAGALLSPDALQLAQMKVTASVPQGAAGKDLDPAVFPGFFPATTSKEAWRLEASPVYVEAP